MRVISQDGKVDIPYDCFSLYISVQKYTDVTTLAIYCRNVSSPGGICLAEYSSWGKALKAMGMLRKAWLAESAEFENGFYRKNCVFRFPADDEVKV